MSDLIITPAREVLDVVRARPVAAVLSMEFPDSKPGRTGYAPRLAEHGFGHVPQMIMKIEDVERTHDYDGDLIPRAPHIVEVGKGLAFIFNHAAKGDVLVHCGIGRRRSSAMALGALALLHPDRDGAALMRDVLALQPIALPNILITEQADILAGRGGELVRAVLDYPDIVKQSRTKMNYKPHYG